MSPVESALEARGISKRLSPEIVEAVAGDVADILRRYPTRTLRTRETAKVLFFTHGIYPSAQLVRHFTRQGSMGDINADLAGFWADVRDKARVKVQGAGLPDDILMAAGDLVQQFWVLAQSKTQTELVDEQQRHQLELAALARRIDELEQQASIRDSRTQLLEAELEAAKADALKFDREVISAREARLAAEQSVAQARDLVQKESQARADAEQRFLVELASARESLTRSEDRLAGEMRFAKINIEEARSSARELQEQVRSLTDEKNLRETQYSIRMNALREELGSAKLALAEATGRNVVLSAENDRLSTQLDKILQQHVRAEVDDQSTLASLQRELINYPSAFEVADLADATLELSSLGDGQGLRLVLSDGEEPRAITPVFNELEELEEFCALNADRYAAIFDGGGNADIPDRWFWDT